MPVRDLITPDNVLSYASAGIEVARATQRLRAQGYESMVVPSRGAVPVMQIAQSYYRSIVRPAMSAADRKATWNQSQLGPLTLSFQAPLTADAGPIGVPGLETAHIRTYWARVIAAIVRNDVNNPTYRLYRFVRDDICKVGHHDSLEWRMRSERLIFIDTVVSGRAVAEIADAFDREGLTDIHYLLLLDENGTRMKLKYAARIRKLEALGRATLIRVPSLFTEDQGPAVSGIWSVVVPKVMDLARTESDFRNGVVGAGLYYVEVQQRADGSNQPLTIANAKLSTLLYQAMHVAADPDHVAEDLDVLGADIADEAALGELYARADIYRQGFDFAVENYLRHIETYDLFDQNSTGRMATPRLLDGTSGIKADVDVSSSHCLRLHIDEDEAVRLIRKFNETLQSPYWEDQERVRRAKPAC